MATYNDRRFAVVTGGSSGIGLELAKQFLMNDFDVMIAAEDARVHDVARELHTDDAIVYPQQVDLATREGREQLMRVLRDLRRPIDAIALNAGVGVAGPFVNTDCGAEIRMIRLNCESVIALAKFAAQQMVARGQGRILITSSIAGTMPAPFEAVYGATKAFDLSFAEALSNELKDTGVTVTAMQPGPTDTRFFERAGLENTRVGVGKKDDPADVARQGFEAMMKGKDKVIVGSFRTKLTGLANEVLPESIKANQHRKQAEPGSGHKS
jgi:short-subunit dehydrogenase